MVNKAKIDKVEKEVEEKLEAQSQVEGDKETVVLPWGDDGETITLRVPKDTDSKFWSDLALVYGPKPKAETEHIDAPADRG